MNKENFLNYLSEAKKIITDNNAFNESLSDNFDKYIEDVKNFSAKVLFVGGFSAGKTALINSLLGGDEILRENITPETAIASEIIYGTQEKVIRVKENGEQEVKQLFEIDNIDNLSIDGFLKYVYILNKPVLNELENIVIVDMPGFDSGIETHNKALMQYIGQGAAYVFVADLEKGTLSRSALDFLNEIKGYSERVIFVLTKRDKLLPSDVEKVKNNIAVILKTQLGTEPNILVTSSREEDSGTRLLEFLKQYSADSLMLHKLVAKAALLLRQGLQAMYIQLSAVNFNPREMDIAITNQERRKKDLNEEMKRAKKNLHVKFQNDIPISILHDVEDSLRGQLPSLVHAAKQGNQSFISAVNNILRPVLINTSKQYIDAEFEDYISSIEKLEDIERQNDDINADIISKKLRNTVNSFEAFFENGKNFAKLNNYKGLYRTVSASLAIVTQVVSPLLELAIVFLPDIIGLFTGGGRSLDDEIRDKIDHEIIHQICEKLRPDIKNRLLETEREQTAAIDEEFRARLVNETEALQKLKDEKTNKTLDVERRKTNLSAGIARLQKIISIIEEEC